MESAPNLVLVGPMGAGKSSIGLRLAERYGLPFHDADREIEASSGAPIATIFECEGEAGFRLRERVVLAQLLAGSGALIATGGGAVIDPDTRSLLRGRGFVVYLQVAISQQLARLARDRSRPLLQGEDREAVLRRLAEVREPLYMQAADLCFDTGQCGAADAAARLATVLDTRWRHGCATTGTHGA
jgi:shikimate kinase